jgi:hypothetical protein
MDKLANNIFDLLKTKDRANEFLDFFSSVKSSTHFVGGVEVQKIIQDTFGDSAPEWIGTVISILPGLRSGKIEKSDLDTLALVEELVKKSSEVRIELSFQPSEDFIDGVLGVLKRNFDSGGEQRDRNFLVNVEVTEGLEPGASVFIDGQFVDLTFRNQVINYLKSKDVVNRYI